MNMTRWGQAKGSTVTLWVGVVFSFLFTAVIWAAAPFLPKIDFLPDTGAAWYYWQLPHPTIWTRASVWTLYVAHQVTIWGLIYYAQKQRPKYSQGLHNFNVWSLAANAIFSVLHLLQTHITYDGLAQDVSIYSSQGSVIILLVLVLLMENQRRGLFFGKKVGFLKEAAQVTRRYHGYIFAWGVIYTFWYHPMETTGGHLIGFVYTFFLMLQGSLMFTRAHLNRYWTTFNELMVLFHGALVAYIAGGNWPMFLFGFATIFVVTQMHGLGWKAWVRWGFLLAYVAGLTAVYSDWGWGRLHEVTRIPVVEYGLIFVFALIIWLGIRLFRGGAWLWRKVSPPSSLSAN